jgi:hypothetical protein
MPTGSPRGKTAEDPACGLLPLLKLQRRVPSKEGRLRLALSAPGCQGATRGHEPWRPVPKPGGGVTDVGRSTSADAADQRILREFLNRVSEVRVLPGARARLLASAGLHLLEELPCLAAVVRDLPLPPEGSLRQAAPVGIRTEKGLIRTTNLDALNRRDPGFLQKPIRALRRELVVSLALKG